MPAERRGPLAFGGNGVRPLDPERLSIDALAHELAVERARPLRRVHSAKIACDARVARDRHVATAFLPQQELQEPLDIALIQGDVRALVGQHGCAIHGHRIVAASERNRERLPAGFRNLGAVIPVPHRCRYELRVERCAYRHLSPIVPQQ